MSKKQPVFGYDHCLACGVCVQTCPVSCLSMDKVGIDKWNKRYPVIAAEGCIGCSLCVKACPMGAMEMEESEE